MTFYKTGAELEYEVMQIFRDAGWETIRSAGSHGVFDVVLVKYTRGGAVKKRKICFVAFVQCKSEKVKEFKEPSEKHLESLIKGQSSETEPQPQSSESQAQESPD